MKVQIKVHSLSPHFYSCNEDTKVKFHLSQLFTECGVAVVGVIDDRELYIYRNSIREVDIYSIYCGGVLFFAVSAYDKQHIMADEKPKVDQKIEKEKDTQPPTTTPAKDNTDMPVKSKDNNDNKPQNGKSTAAVQDEKKKDTNKVSTTTTKIEGKNGNTKPTNTNNSTATTAEDKNDETSMKEKLLKKKLSQKKLRRTKSGDDSHKANDNGDKKKKGGEGGDQKKDNDRRGRKRRSSEDHHRRGGGKRGGHGHHNGRGREGYRGGPPQRDWPPPREFGGRDPYYGRGGPGPRDWDYRGGGDMYGRGPPGGGWGNDRGRYDDRRGPRDFDYDQRFGGGGRRDERERDIYGRGYNNGPPPPPMQQQEKSRSGSISSKGSRSYSRSGSRSYSSRSRSRSRSYSSHSSRGSSRSHSRSYSRSPSRDSGIKKKRSSGSHSRESRDRSSSPAAEVDETTKDQRTIFVSQLVMRADERDISRYFKRKVGTKVRDVILLRDKRTGRHKGCAYVELSSLNDVDRALKATGKIPEFQRFPIMIKRSEAEKNLPGSSTSTAVFTPPGASSSTNHGGQPVQLNEDGKRIEAKQVYVGHIDRCVTQAQLYALFSQFGQLDKVILQMDMSTMISKGFGFLTYRDPKDANLAIQTMSGQMLAGKPL